MSSIPATPLPQAGIGTATQQSLLCFALFGVAYTSNGVSPVLLFYTVDLHLHAAMLAWFFTAYAAGMALSFVLGGPLSDRRGRKAVVVPATGLALAAVAGLLAAARWGTPMLLAARFVQGIGSGAVYAIGTVWLRELAGDRGAASAAVRATAAMAFGFGAGSILSGVLVQWAPWPNVLSLLIMFGLVAAAVAIARGLPETHARSESSPAFIGLPRGSGWGFACYLVPCGLLVYSFVMLAIIAFPLQLERVGFRQIYFIQGLSLIVIMTVATFAIAWVRKLSPANAGWVAALFGAIGCALGYVAVQPGHWLWVVPASVAIGAGSGLAITSGVMVADWLAPPGQRGGLLAAFYVLVYVGDCVPTALSLVWGPHTLEHGGTIVALGIAAVAVGLLLLGPGRTSVLRRRRAMSA